MVGTKSRGYLNSGRLSEGEYSMPFFSTRHSPTFDLAVVTLTLDRVSVPSPIAFDILMDTMARDRAHMYLFSV